DDSLSDLDLQPGFGDRFLRKLDVTGQRVERDAAEPVLADEPDGVAPVPGADVDEELARLWTERGEELEEPVGAAWFEAPRELALELRLAGPELVELPNRCHQPPAIAGSRMIVAPSR